MKLLAIDNLNPGMVLAKDVFSLEGRLLLNQGCSLSEKAFRILNIWGITEAWIEFGEAGEAEEPVVVIDNEFLAKAAALIDDAFTLPRPETAAEIPLREIFLCCAAGDMARFGVAAVVQRYRMAPSSPKAVFRGMAKKGDEGIKEILAGEIRLTVLPETVVHLFNSMNGQYSSSAIAEIIGRDVGLSAKILRVVNSVFYGFPSRIESLSRAVTIIGQRELQNIAIGIALIGMFQECQVADFDMQGFWRHSVGCGILCKCLGDAGTPHCSARDTPEKGWRRYLPYFPWKDFPLASSSYSSSLPTSARIAPAMSTSMLTGRSSLKNSFILFPASRATCTTHRLWAMKDTLRSGPASRVKGILFRSSAVSTLFSSAASHVFAVFSRKSASPIHKSSGQSSVIWFVITLEVVLFNSNNEYNANNANNAGNEKLERLGGKIN